MVGWISPEKIAQMSSRNISVSVEWTKKVVEEMWRNSDNKTKNMAVEYGAFSDTRSFFVAKGKGTISTRMAVALSLAFSVNPYYIIGVDTTNSAYSEDTLKKFITEYGFGHLIMESKDDTASTYFRREFLDQLMDTPLKDIIDLIADRVTERVLEKLNEAKEEE